MTNEAPKTIAEELAAATKLDVNTVKATGWSEQKMADAFNDVSGARQSRQSLNNLSYITGSLSLVTLGMMLVSPRFALFAVPLIVGTWFLRNVGKDMEERRVQNVTREIEKAAMANLTAPKP
jgi:hypothetical protein